MLLSFSIIIVLLCVMYKAGTYDMMCAEPVICRGEGVGRYRCGVPALRQSDVLVTFYSFHVAH